VPSLRNIHMMTLLVSQVFIVLLEFKLQYSCSAVTYQMAPTCSKQMNLPHFAQISNYYFVLRYCIAAALDPAWYRWCANRSTETQATYPRL